MYTLRYKTGNILSWKFINLIRFNKAGYCTVKQRRNFVPNLIYDKGTVDALIQMKWIFYKFSDLYHIIIFQTIHNGDNKELKPREGI